MKVNIDNFYSLCDDFDIKTGTMAQHVLWNPDFYKWSGSGYANQHHYGDGGLAKHTLEVISLMFSCAETLGEEIDKDVVFLAGLYHDIGKLEDYEYDVKNNSWVPTNHKRLIHHISKSAMIFYHQSIKFDIDKNLREKVLHCILSHHMQREWGSPVSPKSKEAWLLCMCDNISARMNDCETWDFVKK